MNTFFNLQQSMRSILWPAQNRLLKEAFLILGGIILLAFSAQCVIPLKPVPLTFQSSTVILLGMLYGARLGSLTVLGYLFSGALGFPVFAEMASGLNPFMGTTAGYLVSFIPAAMLGGFLAQRGWAKNIISAFAAACLSASVIFAIGVTVLSHFVGWYSAVSLGFAPFVLTELLKLFAVALIVPRFWK